MDATTRLTNINFFIESTILTAAISLWAYNALLEAPILLDLTPKKDIGELIDSNKMCPFMMDVEYDPGFSVYGFTTPLTYDLLVSKIQTIMASDFDKKTSWILEQFHGKHLFNEVFFSFHFLISFLSMTLTIGIIQVCVVERLSKFIEDVQKRKEVGEKEKEQLGRYFKHYATEKVLVLAYVIVQFHMDAVEPMPVFKDFSNFVRWKLITMTDITDCTIFGICFCFSAMINVCTELVNNRIFLTLKNSPNLMNRLHSDPTILSILVVSIAVFIFSSFFCIICGLSFHYLNVFYAQMIFLEGYRCWLRSCFVMLRLTFSISASREKISSEMTDEEIGSYLARGGNKEGHLSILKWIYDFSYNLLCIYLYSLYVYYGTTVAGKLLAVIFTRKIVVHLQRLAECVCVIPRDFERLI